MNGVWSVNILEEKRRNSYIQGYAKQVSERRRPKGKKLVKALRKNQMATKILTIMKSGDLSQLKNKGHVFYKRSDFTKEEITQRNPLAIAVLNEGQRVCKHCGGNNTTGVCK